MKKYRDLMFANMDMLVWQLEQENTKQAKKWGIQEHTAFEWLTYITEELGELAEAISESEYRGGRREKVVNEAFQVATLALKIAEMFKYND